jgi:Ran GTPase-activating protein (RanGAP) involved in mRNA processing and transport
MDLSNNAIGFGGNHLSQALAINSTVTYLNLSDNKLGNAGKEIAKLLINNRTLTTLILKGTLIF